MSDNLIFITSQPLDLKQVLSLVKVAHHGGVDIFIGTVRSHTKGRKVVRLEYEAYQGMALSEMDKIAQQVGKRWPEARIAIHHRTGTLDIGEAAVIIAVSTPHRAQAFEACRYAIDTLKENVPIWKKEIFEDGEVWVAAHP